MRRLSARRSVPSRWHEYRALLAAARREGYAIESAEDWLRDRGRADRRVLILRHDVDRAPASALTMARIDAEFGARASWYFRWRTAHPTVIRYVKRSGGQVGLHYETASRRALRMAPSRPGAGFERDCRARLAAELRTFEVRFGPAASACPHGDTRIPDVRNDRLLDGEDLSRYGLEVDAHRGFRGVPLACWLTDRSQPIGGWKDDGDPHAMLARGGSPILVVTHPNNWISSVALWRDSALRASLPDPGRHRLLGRPIRSGPDDPPL